jgi:hypothetical protein
MHCLLAVSSFYITLGRTSWKQRQLPNNERLLLSYIIADSTYQQVVHPETVAAGT